MGHIGFTGEGFKAFRDNNRPGPIQMLNLVKLRDIAEYDDGTKATGAEAYAAYGRLSAPVLARVGGRVIWRGKMEQMLIGPQDVMWDHSFIVEYPDVDAFVAMIKDPEYQAAVPHRQAGIVDSRLIRMQPHKSGGEFSG